MLINRLDSLCTLVVSGQWPSGRRYVSEAQLNPGSDFPGDEMAYARMIHKPVGVPGGPGADGEDGEFTVKLLKVLLLPPLTGAAEIFNPEIVVILTGGRAEAHLLQTGADA